MAMRSPSLDQQSDDHVDRASGTEAHKHARRGLGGRGADCVGEHGGEAAMDASWEASFRDHRIALVLRPVHHRTAATLVDPDIIW